MSELRLLKTERAEWLAQSAERLREIADLLESGDVTEVVVVYNNEAEKHFAKWGHFADRWRLIGALEYAKECAIHDHG